MIILIIAILIAEPKQTERIAAGIFIVAASFYIVLYYIILSYIIL